MYYICTSMQTISILLIQQFASMMHVHILRIIGVKLVQSLISIHIYQLIFNQ